MSAAFSFAPDLIQAGILTDHQLDHAEYLFFRVANPSLPEFRQWLSSLIPTVTSESDCQNWPPEGSLLQTVSISSGISRSLPDLDSWLADPSFRKGMHYHRVRKRLADPDHETYWEKAYLTFPNLMILLASNQVESVQSRKADLLGQLPSPDHVQYLFSESGKRLFHTFPDGKRHRIEHFGYADGISQPAGPADLLVPEPGGSFGSYLVFRKLEQDVEGFRHATRELAAQLGGETAIPFVEAQLMGRFKDGTPLVRSPKPAGQADNDFTFDDDPAGSKCPLHAHIRKVNPRHSPPGEGEIWIGRRSIPYDEVGRDPGLQDAPRRGVGMLFVCYQASIVNQFEHIQGQWASNREFPLAGVRADRMVGQRFGRPVKSSWNKGWNDPHPEKILFDLGNLVWLKGGGYFYTPSIAWLRKLTS